MDSGRHLAMSYGAAGTWPWPPEVPPPQPPEQPHEPGRLPVPPPQPILPTWEEPVPSAWDREIIERLLDERVILLTGRLDDAAAERASEQLLLLGRRDPDRVIDLHLSCRESDLEASLSVVAAIDLAGAPVHTTIRGTLSGPALAVLCASAQRTAHRDATFVLSVPRTNGTEVPGTDLVARAEEHARMVDRLVERIAAATGRAAEEVAQDLRSGRVLSAEEARDYGLVAEVR